MKLSLMVLSEGKASGQSIPINLSQFIIGRDPQCQLRPASALISKRHCAVIARGDKFFVRDFDSTNGTFLNEDQVKGERELSHEDLLKVGPLTFRVNIEGTPVPVNKPTPLPKPLAKETSDDDNVAAMLLDLADEGGTPQHRDADGIPDGTTIMGMMSPFADKLAEGKEGEEGKTDEAGKSGAKAPEKKKETATSSQAAQAILQKYMRRQRPQ